VEILRGIAVSSGVTIGRVLVMAEDSRRVRRRVVRAEHVPAELERFEQARTRAIAELGAFAKQAERELGVEAAKIFQFHAGMLGDEHMVGPVKALIESERVSAEWAVHRVFGDWADRFRAMPDSAFTTKVNDIDDLARRLVDQLQGERRQSVSSARHDTVIVARDLTPSQAAAFDRSRIIGFATELGGRTSHTAILARALDLPAVVGCSDLTLRAAEGAMVIVDGDRGQVIVEPTEEQLLAYRGEIEARRSRRVRLSESADKPAITSDGAEVSVVANIEFPEESQAVLEFGGEGVGLYRTEFLWLTRSSEPSEEDHYESYAKCLRGLKGLPLTIRTVDLGSDKYTQERAETPERNPALGMRSIRMGLSDLGMFRTQLRAILRASALTARESLGPVRVMFPLVTNPSEFLHGRYLIKDVMEDLAEEGVPFDPNIRVGMMVEVPSAALMARSFAKEVDFFSIGTNDLVQYTLAVDRTNERVAHLYNPAHPAVLRLIREVVKAARAKKIPVSCCGESASDPEYAVLLLGLGVRTLSVTASAIPDLKRVVRGVSIGECERVARKVYTLDSDQQVSAFLRDRIRKLMPDGPDGRSGGPLE
jgi:phosphotransferase system enzyme I (PtsI)